MNNNWKITMTTALLTIALTAASLPAAALANPVSAGEGQTASASMKLTDRVLAEVKGVFSEQTADGTTIGAVIKLKNSSGAVTRVPDYELRLSSGDGVVYTLAPSAANARSIQPKGTVELNYLLQVNRTDGLEWTKLSWIHVDEYVYPRKENTLLTIDVAGRVWRADQPQQSETIAWGKPIRLAVLGSDISYTPASIQKHIGADGGNITLVTVKAVNHGKEKAFIPEFAISGTDGVKVYAGSKADPGSIALAAGESKNVRFAIPAAASVELSELVVTTPAVFVGQTGATAVYPVGHAHIGLPAGNTLFAASLGVYEYGTPIAFDPLNELVDKDVRVSLVELHMHDNQGDGYQTAIAKFKLQNTGKQPASLPAFQAELTSESGYTYEGTRQLVAAQKLMPGLSHVVSYSFNVPKSEEAQRYALQLLEGGTAEAPYGSPIAAVGVEVQREADDNTWNLYPFDVKMNSWSLSAVADAIPVISYSYKLTLDLDIARSEDVVVDEGFSRLKIEIADSFDRMLGSETIPFVGVNRLVSGKQTIRFNNIRTEQHQYPLTIHIYEVIDTPNGEATRLIQTLRQR